jgi:DNA-binding IscR family transcriptional regulator
MKLSLEHATVHGHSRLSCDTRADSPVHLKDIAQRQEICLGLSGAINYSLISGGIIHSTRGSKGGIFCKPAGESICKK